MQLKEERLRSLLIRGLVGDASAYHIFLSELTAHLRSFVRRRLAHLPEEVEDLVQELLLAIHNQRHTYDSAQPLTAWVQAIARYKLVDLLRRRSRTNGLHDPLDDVGGWVQLKEKTSERLEFNAAFGLDNVFAKELRPYAVFGGTMYQNLAINRTFTGNVIYTPSA